MSFWNWFKSLFGNKSSGVSSRYDAQGPAWYEVAQNQVGVKEVPGSGNNPDIIKYHSATSLRATQDSVPWCSAFVCWCIEQSGIRSTRSALARSWSSWGRRSKMRVGAICVLRRGTKAWQGHVGFVADWNDHSVMLLGGNQNDKVCYRNYKRSEILDIRFPLS